MQTETVNSRTLFDRIGGAEAVEKLVEEFYQRILNDPELAPFFRGASMEKLRKMQFEFFSSALDGPVNYTGKPVEYAHRGRGITSKELSKFMGHLLETIQFVHPNEKEMMDMYSRIGLCAESVIDGATGGSE